MASPTAMSSAVDDDSESAAILALSQEVGSDDEDDAGDASGYGCAHLQATSVIRSSSSTTSSTTMASSSLAPASDVTTAASATPTNWPTAKMTTTLAPPIATAPVSCTSTTPTTSMKTNGTLSTPMVFGLGTPGATTAYVGSTSISMTVHVTCSMKGPDHTRSVPVPICLTANSKIIKKLRNSKTLLKRHGKDLVCHWLEDMEADKAKVAAGTLLPHKTTINVHQASSTFLLPATTSALTSTPTPVASSEQDHASDAPTTCSILGPCIDADTGRTAVTSQIEIDVLPSAFAAPSVEAEVPSDLSIMFLTQGSSHDIVAFLCPESHSPQCQ
ncbi:hypothetical protein BS78_04G112100 [Paspalum vaginatum]|nr:hypothetical protein BS78_04G112100 [Paspalum vaginatum]